VGGSPKRYIHIVPFTSPPPVLSIDAYLPPSRHLTFANSTPTRFLPPRPNMGQVETCGCDETMNRYMSWEDRGALCITV